MRAAVLCGKEKIKLIERPIPSITEDEVLIRVKCTAICGTDVRMYKNGIPGRELSEENALIMGHEMAGVVEQVGSQVAHYKKGMRVTVAPNMGCGICDDCIRGNGHMCRDYRALGINLDGGFAEYVRIPAAAVRAGNIMEISDKVSFEEAALIEALSCVHNGSSQCQIKPGESVLVIGAGPIGVMHALMARMVGAGKVMINDINRSRLEECGEIDKQFLLIDGSPKEKVAQETGQKGADVIIVACPVPAVQQQALELAANYGRVCFFGGLPDDRKEVSLNTNLIHYKQLTVTGTTRASLHQFKEALEFVEDGLLDVKKLVTHRSGLDEIEEEFARASRAKGLKNVICI